MLTPLSTVSQDIAYNDNFQKGNRPFRSNYSSSLLLVYKGLKEDDVKSVLGRILLLIMHLQLGALSEDLTRTINDNLFAKKDDGIDLFDDFGELIQLKYKSAGVSGWELMLEKREFEIDTPIGNVLAFA